MSTVKTEHADLTWNPRPRSEDGKFIKGGRLEGTYRGVKLEPNVVYQFDTVGGPFGHSVTPGVFTGTWLGYVDGSGEPVFQHVDDHSIKRLARGATWFERLDNITEEN